LARRSFLAIGVSIAALILLGCSTLRHVFHMDDKASQRADHLEVLQLRVQRFADEYVSSIVQPIRSFQAGTDNAEDRLTAQNWLLSQATAAYTIASGPSPVVNTVDLVVLATLSRMVIDDAWIGERFGERAGPLRDSYHRLEPIALDLAKGALSADQINELEQVIAAWRAQNPQVTAIASVHFRDVASSLARSKRGGGDSFGGLFNVLGLDPFSSLDPAVREITQSRQLAERTVYYAQRLPGLLDMQVERLTFEWATMPETTQLLANADQVAGAAATSARVVAELPSFLTREREAAIRQFMDAVTVETAHTRKLVTELRSALDSGTATSESLNTTIRSFDGLMARFDKPTAAGGSRPPARPFDITEYTSAAAEITRTATELQTLIAGIDRDSPALGQAADRATAALQSVVDHAYWRTVQLLALLIGGSLGAALTYRLLVRRR
jgi:hypothetical protein